MTFVQQFGDQMSSNEPAGARYEYRFIHRLAKRTVENISRKSSEWKSAGN